MTRIALIHALSHSVAPINDALARDWPAAQRMNLLDDSLSADLLARGGQLDLCMTQRFIALTDYAVATGVDGILFTCSAFGPCIEAAQARHPGIPVLKPNEAMVDEAVAASQQEPIGLVASFAPTLNSLPLEFPPGTPLRTALAEGALDALNLGDVAHHDQLVADAAWRLANEGCRVIALTQFSLAHATPLVAACTQLPVLNTVDSAVKRLRQRLAA
ncbi:MAG: arylsulfatase [Rubrivivax sp.]|nr:arylsulfatase [Rubrivivax sp.]